MFLMQEFLGCRLFLLLFSIEETIKRVQINVFFLIVYSKIRDWRNAEDINGKSQKKKLYKSEKRIEKKLRVLEIALSWNVGHV